MSGLLLFDGKKLASIWQCFTPWPMVQLNPHYLAITPINTLEKGHRQVSSHLMGITISQTLHGGILTGKRNLLGGYHTPDPLSCLTGVSISPAGHT